MTLFPTCYCFKTNNNASLCHVFQKTEYFSILGYGFEKMKPLIDHLIFLGCPEYNRTLTG